MIDGRHRNAHWARCRPQTRQRRLATFVLLLVMAALFQGVAHDLLTTRCEGETPGCGVSRIIHTHDHESHQGCTTLNCSAGQIGLVRLAGPLALHFESSRVALGPVPTLESANLGRLLRPPIGIA